MEEPTSHSSRRRASAHPSWFQIPLQQRFGFCCSYIRTTTATSTELRALPGSHQLLFYKHRSPWWGSIDQTAYTYHCAVPGLPAPAPWSAAGHGGVYCRGSLWKPASRSLWCSHYCPWGSLPGSSSELGAQGVHRSSSTLHTLAYKYTPVAPNPDLCNSLMIRSLACSPLICSRSMAPVAAAPLRLAGGVVRTAALWVWLLAWAGAVAVAAANFYRDVDVTWGDGRGKILDGGRLLTLSLDRASGAGFQSKSEYLYGRFDVQLRLVPGNSAGTVTSYYLSSEGAAHDEIDFEFLGNLTGDPYVVHTNIYTQGKGGREQQFYLWFDPTKGFHTYSVLWNPRHVVFYVDGTPIREFRNEEAAGGGVPFPEEQPMRVYGSLWNADDWATRGGLVKTDWSKAPFVASYRDFGADACRWSSGASSCGGGGRTLPALSQELGSEEQARLRWVRKNYLVYDYCADVKRFPQGLPPECTRP